MDLKKLDPAFGKLKKKNTETYKMALNKNSSTGEVPKFSMVELFA